MNQRDLPFVDGGGAFEYLHHPMAHRRYRVGTGMHGIFRPPGRGEDTLARFPVHHQRQAHTTVDGVDGGHDLVADMGDTGVDGPGARRNRG